MLVGMLSCRSFPHLPLLFTCAHVAQYSPFSCCVAFILMLLQVVPKGQARIRVQLSASHTTEQVNRAADAFIAVGKQLRVIP